MLPFLNLAAAYQAQKQEIDAAVSEVLASGSYLLGEQLEGFEEDWARYCGARYAVGVGSGLDALSLALMALGIGEGDEVIVPSFTFVATWLAVSQVGARPVPVDCSSQTFNIQADLVKSAITNRTKAIVPVHLFGQPADLRAINELAKCHGLHVVEDAAQAHGAELEGARIGSHGNTVCWSFYPGKNLGCMGDGGAITTNCEQLRDAVAGLRNYGARVKYHHDDFGRNSRLDEIQAAILRRKLTMLDSSNGLRREIADFYTLHLDSNKVRVPNISPSNKSVWHQFVVLTSERDRLRHHLSSEEFQR